jgi:phosphodiesterase/alkaline phosphatase D-like protein
MQELKTCYTLDEALKLYALIRMDNDVEAAHAKEVSNKNKGR